MNSTKSEQFSKELYDRIREDVELCLGNHIIEHLNIEDVNNQHFLQNLLENSEIKNVANTVYRKYESQLKLRIQSSPDPNNDDFWSAQGFMETQNYSTIIRNLDRVNSVQLRLSALDALISSHVLDTSVPQIWTDLLTKLKYCIIDKNIDIAMRSVQVHYKIISTQLTCSEGYLNLLRATSVLFKSTKRFNNETEMDLRNSYTDYSFKLVNFILKMQLHVQKNWSYIKDEERCEIVNNFMQLCSNQLQNDYNISDLKPIHWIACLDFKANWFKKFNSILSSRLYVHKYFKNNPALVKYCVNDILYNLQNFNISRSLEVGVALNKEILSFASLSHSLEFIAVLVSFDPGRNIFPVSVRLHAEPVTLAFLINSLINTINNEYIGQSQRNILINPTISMIFNNIVLLKNNKTILQNIFQPFSMHVLDKRYISKVISNNLHILNVTKFLISKNFTSSLLGFFESTRNYSRLNSNSKLTNKRNRNRRFSISDHPTSATSIDSTSANVSTSRDFVPVQVLLEITDFCIRQYIVQNEFNLVMQNLITELLNICSDLFINPKIIMYGNVDSHKFLTRLCDFYKCTTNHKFYEGMENRIKISKIIVLFCTNQECLSMISQDKGFLYEIVSNVLNPMDKFWDDFNSTKYIINISNTSEGGRIIAKHQRELIGIYLMNVWQSEEDEYSFLTGSERVLNKSLKPFMKIIYTLSFSAKSLRFILLDDDKDTINGDNDKPMFLSDLIEICLLFNGDPNLETTIGLLTLQILISNNLDVLLYFQNAYKLKEEIVNIQMQYSEQIRKDKGRVETDPNIIVDMCTVLRQNILFLLNNVGTINSRIVENFNHDTSVSHMYTSSALKRRLRGTNDLHRYLHDYKNALHDNGWLIQVRKIFKTTCSEIYKPSMVFDLIEQVIKVVPNKKHNYTWPSNENQIDKLFPEDYIGISSIINFGLQNGLLQNSAHNDENLKILLMQSQLFLKCHFEDFENFDWFVGIIFLICSGNLEKSKIMLLNLINFASAPILWFNFNKYIYKKSNSIYSSHIKHINMVLEDFPKLSSSFEMLGISIFHLLERWNIQSFISILDFIEICNFICICVLYPPEYAAYFNISVLKHLQHKIITFSDEDGAFSLLKLTQIDGFRTCNYINSMEKMGKKYKSLYFKT